MKCLVANFILQNQNDFQEIKEELTDKDRQRQGCMTVHETRQLCFSVIHQNQKLSCVKRLLNWPVGSGVGLKIGYTTVQLVLFLDKKSRRVAHAKATKHSVKKVDFMSDSSGSQTKSKEDDNLFARLEELERQEQMNSELENEEYFADYACDTNSDKSTNKYNESTVNETRNTSRAKNSSSHIRVNSDKERAQTSCTVKEQNTSSLSEGCSLEIKRAANACTTQSEKNDARDTCSLTKAVNSNDLDKHSVKKVSWKENIVEKPEEHAVVGSKHGKATIYFTHSTGTV